MTTAAPVVCMMSRVARAELRVYSPLPSFARNEQEHWAAYVTAGKCAPRLSGESPAGWASLERLLEQAERGDGQAYVMQRDGHVLLCPRRLELRALYGLLAMRGAVLPPLAEAVMPRPIAERAASELERFRARHPGRRSHVRSSAWHVPEQWFVAVDESERRYSVDGDGKAGITYETEVDAAVSRLSIALRVAEDAELPDGVVGALRSLGAWLEGFAEDSIIELDYGTVAGLFTPETLADDHSARDARAALEALSRGDIMRSGFFYAALTERWIAARAKENSS